MTEQQPSRTDERTPGTYDKAPDFVAHWVVKTSRRQEMTDWYATVFGARVVHTDKDLSFLSWDHEHHRLALIALPGFVRFLFPFAKYRRKLYGMDHVAVQLLSIEKLLALYERLKPLGIEPVWAINHGPTTSLYYEDPDGIRLELQVDNFPTIEETAAFFGTKEFEKNPIGTLFDPDYLLMRLRRGDDPAELLKPGAGTPPGTKVRKNKKALSWKAL
jgi:catechol 2,3-dioxygenase-like lactoylglutathione lyase family enzyme